MESNSEKPKRTFLSKDKNDKDKNKNKEKHKDKHKGKHKNKNEVQVSQTALKSNVSSINLNSRGDEKSASNTKILPTQSNRTLKFGTRHVMKADPMPPHDKLLEMWDELLVCEYY